jgi:hypothetical protein
MLRLLVDDPDTPSSSEELVAIEEEYEVGKMSMATVVIERSKLRGISTDLEEGRTELYVERNNSVEFGGKLRDVERGEPESELVVNSFESYARETEPVPGDDIYENVADSTIVGDAIDAVPHLSRGTIETVETGLTIVFSHVSPARKLREVTESTGAFLSFNPDGTVDYVADPGVDNTDITVSPSESNVTNSFDVTRDAHDKRVTHMRLLGAGEGQHQVTATVAPQDDSTVYENDGRYANPDWEQGDDKTWDTYSNKDAQDSSTLISQGLAKINDEKDVSIDVETTVSEDIIGETIDIGDRYHLAHSEDEVDHDLTVVSVTRVSDTDGILADVTFSSRSTAVSLERTSEKNRKDLDRYGHAFEGTPVTLTTGGGRQPVDSNVNYEFSFYYPDEVKHEHRVKLVVKGDSYRAYSSGAEAGGDHTHTFEYIVTGEHNHEIPSDEFQHRHALEPSNTATEDHEHGDGSYDADSHPHRDGTYDTDSHDHSSGSFDANSHGHSLSASTDSEVNYEHGRVADDDSGLQYAGGTGGSWEQFYTFNFSNYEFIAIHFIATRCNQVVEVRVKNTQSTAKWPSYRGQAIWGTSNEAGSGTGFIMVPQDVGWVECQYKTDTNDSVGNIAAVGLAIGEHSHPFSLSTDTDNSQPGVSGYSGNTQPGVSGRSSYTSPGVSGLSGTEAPGLTGDSNVTGGVRTSTTETETTEETTTPPDQGGHEHAVEPGINEFNREPSGCDVRVNGQVVEENIGDGEFETQIDLEGELNTGSVNSIEVTSDTLGHVQAHVDIDVYRQILGDG